VKKVFSILTVIIILVSLCACGGGGTPGITDTNSDTTTLSAPGAGYDYLPGVINMRDSYYKSMTIKGGAMLAFQLNDLNKTELREYDNNYMPYCIFDEATGVVYPLCFDMTCDHTGENCFARKLCDDPTCCVGVSDGIIYQISPARDSATAIYYSFDGVIQKQIKTEYKDMTPPEGTSLESITKGLPFLQKDNMVYMDYYKSGDKEKYTADPENSGPFTRFILSYDLNTEIFAVAAAYEVKTSNSKLASFIAFAGDILYVEFDRVLYACNIKTGESSVTADYGALGDEIVGMGYKITSFSTRFIEDGYIDISAYKSDSTQDYDLYLYDLATGEIVQTDSRIWYDFVFYREGRANYGRIMYEGRTYRVETYTGLEENLTESKSAPQRGFCLNRFICQTENGFIFKLAEYDESGKMLPESVIKNEGGSEAHYFLPAKYAYISNEDFFAGNIENYKIIVG
jgi:hypothetical protein